ncbi:oxidoreductase [Amycolatopsis coloradensis]|uniref:Oxidoreductase n=1 Tax=Amycolatopsis coloradensis TaxID=76021 RepID=A0A1R0L420_9PSEU|nr:Gfo/Idh/MocA family oxidoreductase [Amycolatopsis coloradensis]OLZ57396.1 oxidoreductase [Amycolatopsis coloradensis]
MKPLAVGLAGAGPWAGAMHAPTLAKGPETTLAAVWTRRREAAETLAKAHGSVPVASFDELLDHCEAVAFAVPPSVQAVLAVRAANRGKALLLEKPVALTVPDARRVAEAVGEAGVVSQLVLTKRYHPRTRDFLERAATFTATGARSCYLHGAFLGGEQATSWRLEHGALLDLGPHLLDLLEAAVGPIASLRGTGDPRHWLELTCEHENGVVSQASLSGSIGLRRASTVVDLFGPDGQLHYDTAELDHAECWPVLRREFAAAVRSGRPPALDVWHGLRLQELLDRAQPPR